MTLKENNEKIGELQTDENGRRFRIINGKKIYQAVERTKEDEDFNRRVNNFRASGMKMSDYLRR